MREAELGYLEALMSILAEGLNHGVKIQQIA